MILLRICSVTHINLLTKHFVSHCCQFTLSLCIEGANNLTKSDLSHQKDKISIQIFYPLKPTQSHSTKNGIYNLHKMQISCI